MSERPRLFFDRDLPARFADLVDGRATPVGPDDADLEQCDAVIAGMRQWDDEALSRAPHVRVISRLGVGYDTVDVDAATARGITVCHAPDAPTVSTAEHTIALILQITKALPGRSQQTAGAPTRAIELDGRVLGLLGLGRIGRRVARNAGALGMRPIAHDPQLGPVGTEVDGTELVEFEALWQQSDVVSLHAPALPETRHVVNRTTLALMKPDAYLINCARGALVDQGALLAALDEGRLAGVALDVTEPEPLPPDHPLRAHAHVVVTPHVASHTTEGFRRIYEHAIDNALAVLAGRPATVVPEQAAPASPPD